MGPSSSLCRVLVPMPEKPEKTMRDFLREGVDEEGPLNLDP